MLRSCEALYLAFSNESGAFSIKCCNTLSKNLIKSGIKLSSFSHSLYFYRFTLDKQHTAVLSSFVCKVISEQRLL